MYSEWYLKEYAKGTMWTQLFLYYTEHRGLFNVYLTLRKNETLAANWAEPGKTLHLTMYPCIC